MSKKYSMRADQPKKTASASLLGAMDTIQKRKAKFKEINALRNELNEVKSKYDNQRIVLEHTEEELKATKKQFKVLNSEGSLDPKLQSKELLLLQHEKNELQGKVHSAEANNEALLEELNTFRMTVEAQREDSAEKENLLQRLHTELDRVSQQNTQYQRDVLTNENKYQASREKNEALTDRLQEMESRMAAMESESKRLDQLKQDKKDADARASKFREQLIVVSRESAKLQHQQQNNLQGTRQFLEELKIEYQEFTEVTNMNHEMYKETKTREHNTLKEEYERFKMKNYEQMQELHREQQEIVHSLQAQFQEYRSTAETLFYNEARQLEEKLNQQQQKYEQEIRYIVKAKDQHFEQMITSKDAKIMNLVEGTDFQKMLVKHQMEMEHIKKQHQRDLEMTREMSEAQQKKVVYNLKKEISAKGLEIDKYHTQILNWEKKLEATLGLLKKQRKQHALKEENSEMHVREIQAQLNKSYATIEGLIQKKENYRHRILRLRLQIEGKADDSLDSVCKRLSKETERLRTDLELLSFKYKTKIEENEKLVQGKVKQEQSSKFLQKELARRTKEYRSLTSTFEQFLHDRVKDRIHGAGRVSLFDPNIERMIHDMREPFLAALMRTKGGKSSSLPPMRQGGGTDETQRLHFTTEGDIYSNSTDHATDNNSKGLIETLNKEEKGYSRTSRLRDIMKSIPGMNANKSLPSTPREARGGSSAGQAFLSSLPQETDATHHSSHSKGRSAPRRSSISSSQSSKHSRSGEAGGRAQRFARHRDGSRAAQKRLKKKKPRAKFVIPARLKNMVEDSGNNLVDQGILASLQDGFEILDKFKSLSHEFSDDTHGLKSERERAERQADNKEQTPWEKELLYQDLNTNADIVERTIRVYDPAASTSKTTASSYGKEEQAKVYETGSRQERKRIQEKYTKDHRERMADRARFLANGSDASRDIGDGDYAVTQALQRAKQEQEQEQEEEEEEEREREEMMARDAENQETDHLNDVHAGDSKHEVASSWDGGEGRRRNQVEVP